MLSCYEFLWFHSWVIIIYGSKGEVALPMHYAFNYHEKIWNIHKIFTCIHNAKHDVFRMPSMMFLGVHLLIIDSFKMADISF